MTDAPYVILSNAFRAAKTIAELEQAVKDNQAAVNELKSEDQVGYLWAQNAYKYYLNLLKNTHKG